jgi:hypothetical protein
MPHDGSFTLSDLRGPTLSIVCAPYGLRGVCRVAKLREQHGNAKLTDLLHEPAACSKARSASVQRPGQHKNPIARQRRRGERARAVISRRYLE